MIISAVAAKIWYLKNVQFLLGHPAFVDNLFFYLGGQSVSCKASLAALRLYG